MIKPRRLLFVLPLAVAFLLPPPVRADPLPERLAELLRGYKGRVTLAYKHLDTGEGWSLQGDEPMPTASLIKFPILIELYLQAAEGKVNLGELIALRDKDKVPGSGILTYHFSEGALLSLRDLGRLMIVFSDNTATNMVLDKIGLTATNNRMKSWGLPETRVNAKVFRGDTTALDKDRTGKFGLGSTTANETIRLLEKVHKGEVVSPKICQEMLGHMKKCDDAAKLKRNLPRGTVVAHKTGSVDTIKTDAGIIYTPGGPVAVCVLTSHNEDQRWEDDNAAHVLIGKVGREVYDYFKAKKGTAKMEKEKS